MSKLERLYHLHEILKSRRTPVSRHVLMERLECSQATLYRLIAALRDELGAPIEQDEESRDFYYDHDLGQFELPGIWLSGEEIRSLVAARQLLARVQPGLLDEELGSLRDRIGSLLDERGLDSDSADRFIRIIHHGGRDVPRDTFREVMTALNTGRRLHITYASRTSGECTERDISPQRLTSYRDNWYLDAWCHWRDGLRSFALEQIERLERLDEAARVVASPDMKDHYQSAYGIFAGQATQTADILFSARMSRWVADERWHSAQQGEWLDDGRYRLRVPYGHSEELIMDILRYGPEAKVVSPASLVRAISDRLATAAAQYEGKR